ncbi:hypothetical protein RF55_9561 [Lasius niger]|uniref:Uncharacterized protein n=1 Tax=Lasius niger TaxID=67767 RepID=A0A0J7KKB1_LASNI|nr:hypothetical protein RF55_9561 [Lasius niger]
MKKSSESSQEMADEKDNLYAVVLFLPRKLSNNLIDLIPSFWIVTKNRKVLCQYPGSEDYFKISDWVATLKEYEEEWKHFDIEILCHARSLKQGKRRLNRALTTMEIQSTDCDNLSSKENSIPILNEVELHEELNNIQEMSINATNEIEHIIMLANINENAFTLEEKITYGFLKKYMDEKFDGVLAAINSVKKSILYDFEIKINEMKRTIVANRPTEVPSDNLRNIKDDLGIVLPMKMIADFLSFEEAIETSEVKKKALINFYRVLICGETTMKMCVKKIMTATISKSTEMDRNIQYLGDIPTVSENVISVRHKLIGV